MWFGYIRAYWEEIGALACSSLL